MPDVTSEPKLIQREESAGRIHSIVFSVGPTIPGDVEVRFFAEGLTTTGGHLFDWCLEVERTRTLPRIVLVPIEKFGRGVWRMSKDPLGYGVRPILGYGIEVKDKLLKSGRKKKVRWADQQGWSPAETPGGAMTPRSETGVPLGILKGRRIL